MRISGIMLQHRRWQGADRHFEGSLARNITALRRLGRVSPLLLLIGLDACDRGAAPSFVIAGSYFPGWMFCALIGVAAAVAARIVFVLSRLADILPFQFFVCSAVGLNCALIAWLPLFGR